MARAMIPQEQIPAYGGTVFISYARVDDDPPPLDEKTRGWVAFFWQQLRWELNNVGVHRADLWLDRYEIDPTEDFTEKIEEALHKARLIIPILSNNWVQRDWCQKELSKFVELREENNDPGDNIVLVKKRELLREADMPVVLRNRQGYQFFSKDPSGRLREFYWRGLKDEKAYFEVLSQMAEWIAKQLLAELPPRKVSAPSNGRVIYLAAPTGELRDAWQRLANDLHGSGYIVLPSEDRLPDTVREATAAISDALDKAELSVHFLGESEGSKPDGSDETFVRLQLRLARERAAAGIGLPLVLWAPKWLPGSQENKRDPFKVVERFGGLLTGEEVYAEEVTDLSQWLRARLNPIKLQPARVAIRLLVAAAEPEDDDLVAALANRLQSDEIVVQPLFAGEPPPSGDLPTFSAVLVPWGKADRASLDALLSILLPLGARFMVLSLPGDDETAKRRFFRQGVYVEQLEALPPDRRTARDLLVQLEITTSDDGPEP